MVNANALRADVTRMLERWQPTGWEAVDVRLLEPLISSVREWVAAAEPSNPNRARHMLSATALMVVWAKRNLGTTDVGSVLHPENVELFSMVVNKHRPAMWRESTRGVLRTVGRAANPYWPPPPSITGRRPIAAPYTRSEETKWVRAGRLVGRANRAARMWVVGGSLGGGLRGPELVAARTEDVVGIADRQLAVRVRGRQPRLVPIRQTYTDLVWEAISDAPGGRFITSTSRNAVHWTVDLLTPLNGEKLSLRRARSTWLLAHFVAGTPLNVLQHVAGSLSGNTLTGLLQHTEGTLDDETAALGALWA